LVKFWGDSAVAVVAVSLLTENFFFENITKICNKTRRFKLLYCEVWKIAFKYMHKQSFLTKDMTIFFPCKTSK
jgi:hypothetical protein